MSDDRLREIRLDSTQLLDGKLLKVYADTVRLPDGSTGLREWIRHPGAVAIIPYRREGGRVILVRQFRYPVGRALWELPAGKLDPGEEVEACGRRELEEETGWRAGTLSYVMPLLPCIGYSNEVIHLLYCEDPGAGRAGLDSGEFLEVHEFSLAELEVMLGQGEIQDGKTLVGLYWLLLRETRRGFPGGAA